MMSTRSLFSLAAGLGLLALRCRTNGPNRDEDCFVAGTDLKTSESPHSSESGIILRREGGIGTPVVIPHAVRIQSGYRNLEGNGQNNIALFFSGIREYLPQYGGVCDSDHFDTQTYSFDGAENLPLTVGATYLVDDTAALQAPKGVPIDDLARITVTLYHYDLEGAAPAVPERRDVPEHVQERQQESMVCSMPGLLGALFGRRLICTTESEYRQRRESNIGGEF